MNTQQLESFLAVAENLNFARAAESLNITQSAVSRQIHALEEELGTNLFRRTSRSVSLTLSGISFYEDARNFMRDLKIATDKIKYDNKPNTQPLIIGYGNDCNCTFFTAMLKLCHKQLPELRPFIRIIPHRSIVSMFFQGDIDIMFGFENDVPPRSDISYMELTKTPICCAIASDHPFADKLEIRESELKTESIILCNSYALPSISIDLQSKMRQHFSPEFIHFCDNPNVLLTLVKAGYGFGILPEINVDEPGISSIPLVPEHSVSFGLFYKKNSANPMVKEFLSIAHETQDSFF